MKEKKLPIIVGGTNYYIESLLWKVLVQEFEPNTESKVGECFKMDEFSVKRFCEQVDNMTKRVKSDASASDKVNKCSNNNKLTEDTCFDVTRLHTKLKEVDPDMAAALHPSNTRKIMR